jgi:hypothetical protein
MAKLSVAKTYQPASGDYSPEPLIVDSIKKYGYQVTRLPREVTDMMSNGAYLDPVKVQYFTVFSPNLFVRAISKEEPTNIVNKKAQDQMLQTVGLAIKTAYMTPFQDVVQTTMEVIDVTLDMQRLRIVFMPTSSLLAVISF